MVKAVDKTEAFEVVPFTVVIDTNEGAPYQFTGILGRSKNGVKLPQVIRTVKKPMWAMGRQEFGVGLADYSIDGLETEIQIERKSISDLFGTLGGRRQNFENEIARMSEQCKVAYVMIEGSYGHIASFRDHGPEPSSVIGTMVSWGQKYRNVHWITAGSRDMAERLTFRMLESFWIHREAEIKKAAKQSKLTDSSQTEGSTGNDCANIEEEAKPGNQMGRNQPAGSGCD